MALEYGTEQLSYVPNNVYTMVQKNELGSGKSEGWLSPLLRLQSHLLKSEPGLLTAELMLLQQ